MYAGAAGDRLFNMLMREFRKQYDFVCIAGREVPTQNSPTSMSPFSTGIADPRKKTTFAGGISCLLGTARDQREMVNHMAQEEGSASGPGRKGRGNVERGWLMR